MNKLKTYLLSGYGVLLLAGVIALLLPQNGYANVAGDYAWANNIDSRAIEPFQKSVTVTMTAGVAGTNVWIPDVPSGKLLVIEQVSAYGVAPWDQEINFSLMTRVVPNYSYISHYLLSNRLTKNSLTSHTVSQTVKIYADAPGFYARVSRSSSPDTVTFFFNVSGYLIDK